MFEKQRFPKLEPRGFLERAFFWLNSDSDFRVFYAAIELRFTFEKIYLNHGMASNNNSQEFTKLNWKPKQLYLELVKEFSNKIDLSKAYKFIWNGPGLTNPIIFGYYLPFDEELFGLYGRLDQFLHAQWAIPIGYPDKRWQIEKSNELLLFAKKLIPHANPQNRLTCIDIPNIKFVEIDMDQTKQMLANYWTIEK